MYRPLTIVAAPTPLMPSGCVRLAWKMLADEILRLQPRMRAPTLFRDAVQEAIVCALALLSRV